MGCRKSDVAPFIDKFNLISKAEAHKALQNDDDFLDSNNNNYNNNSSTMTTSPTAAAGSQSAAEQQQRDLNRKFRCCVPNLVHLWGMKYPDGNVISDCHNNNLGCQHLHKAELMKLGMYTRSNVVGALHIYYAKNNKDRLQEVLKALDADVDIQPEQA